MKKIILTFALIYLSTHTVTAQVSSMEKAIETTGEEIVVEIEKEVKAIEIKPNGEAIEVQVQTEQQAQSVQTFPLPTENRKIVEVEVKDIITNVTSPVSLEQTPQGEIEIKDAKISATTMLPVKIAEQEISVEVRGKEQTIILPSQATEAVIEVKPTDSKEQPTVLDVELLECEAKEGPEPPDCKVIYRIETEEESKLLGLIPIKSKLSYEVNATNGKLLAEKKPWYLRILPFLFV